MELCVKSTYVHLSTAVQNYSSPGLLVHCREGGKKNLVLHSSKFSGALHIILTKGISTREKRSSLMHAWDRHIAELSDEYLKGVAKTGTYIIS